MNNAKLIAGLALSTLVFGCDANPKCEQLAQHITDVIAKEKGEDVPQEAKDKSKKDILDACNTEAPPEAVLDCSLKAQTRDALVECDKLAKEE